MTESLAKLVMAHQDSGRNLVEAVREIGKQEGIQIGRKEVAEWVEENHGNCPGTMEYLAINTHKWHAFLKDLFKDNPELLKEWGLLE